MEQRLLLDLEKRNIQLHKYCCDLQKLFVIWPGKHETESGRPAISGDITDESNKSTAPLTMEEQNGLVLLDKMLNEAQKARNVQHKLQDEPRQREPRGVERTEQQCGSKSLHRDSLLQVTDTEPLLSKASRERFVSSTSMIKDKRTVQTRQDSSAQLKSTLKASVYRMNGDAKVTKKNKVLPAHVNAPFKTDPALPAVTKKSVIKKYQQLHPTQLKTSVKISVSKSELTLKSKYIENNRIDTSCRQTVAEQNQQAPVQIAADQNQHMPGQTVADQNQQAPVQTIADHIQKAPVQTVADQNQQAPVNGISTQGHEACPNLSNSDDSNTAIETMQNFDLEEINKRAYSKLLDIKISGMTSTEQPKQSGFNLLTDGSTLNIPNKVKRLYANNRKLRQKISTQRLTKKVKDYTSREDFILKVEEMFETCEVQSTCSKSERISKVYETLSNLLEDVCMESLSVKCSAYSILRTRKMLEFILTEFYQSEEERLQINSKADLHHSSFSSGIMLYKQRADLLQYAYFVFQLQYQQLYMKLLDQITAEIMPLLKLSDGNVLWMYRGLQTILSCEKVFPVIVQDNI